MSSEYQYIINCITFNFKCVVFLSKSLKSGMSNWLIVEAIPSDP